MKIYRTLKNEIYDITIFPLNQREIYERVWNFYQKHPHWDKFTAFWLSQIDMLQSDLSRQEIVETPVYKICEDMDSRLAIEQGYARREDYRDELSEIIDSQFPSRYAFCYMMALDEGYLSRVLNKRQHISIKKLEQLLDTMGYELTIREKA